MLTDEFTAVEASSTCAELQDAVMKFMRRLEFDTMGAGSIVESGTNESMFRTVHNAPRGYLAAFDDVALGRRDPVMQHCRTSSLPIVWNQDTYLAANCMDKWEMQAAYGYKAGIAAVIHLPRGRHFYLGLNRDQALSRDKQQLTRMVADLQLFTVLACEAAFRVLWRETSISSDIGTLTARETECLRWTMEGKTAWEVGKILTISEQTAVRHINNATHKLGCMNKHQAVLKALRLGLIR
jgi:DNA-binding CsgD family transcriptional regulator